MFRKGGVNHIVVHIDIIIIVKKENTILSLLTKLCFLIF